MQSVGIFFLPRRGQVFTVGGRSPLNECRVTMPTLRSVCAAALVVISASACGQHEQRSGNGVQATATSASASRGSGLFAANCASCHGSNGSGGRVGPTLHDERKRKTAIAIREAISDPQPPMPKLYPAVLTDQDVDDLTAYVESL